MVGVVPQVVTPSFSIRRSTSSGSKRPSRRTTFAPIDAIMTTPATSPDTWKRGVVRSVQGGAVGIGAPVAIRVAAPFSVWRATAARIDRWVSTAPFARPVVPDV